MPMQDPLMKVSPRNPSRMQELEQAMFSTHAANQLKGTPNKSVAPPTLPTLQALGDIKTKKMNTDVLDSDNYFYRRPTLSNGSTLSKPEVKNFASKSPRLESISPRNNAAGAVLSADGSPNYGSPVGLRSSIISPRSINGDISGNGSFNLSPPIHPLDQREVPTKASFGSRPSFLDRKPSRHDSMLSAREILANQKQ